MKVGDRNGSSRTIMIWVLSLLVFILLAVFINIAAAIVAFLFVLAFMMKVNPQVPYAVTLVFLLLCVLMTLIDQQSAARFLANWAYCFFAIGVVLHFCYYLKTSPDGDEGE